MRKIEKITKKELELAIIGATSYAGILKNLNTYSDGPNYIILKRRLHEFDIDPKWRERYEERFRKAVIESQTMTDVIEFMGLSSSPNNFKRFKAKIFALELDTSHWTKNKPSAKAKTAMLRRPEKRKRPLVEYLVIGSNISSNRLKKYLIKEGLLKNECSFSDCPTNEMGSWRGGVIALELDHINGISYDNRLENLRILCRMCHAQTPTYSRKTT